MRIPLDYYRILGLPIQATSEQLQQAYGDRAQQLPRREYSEVAIAARKQLLEGAYAVLSNPEERSSYDARFLAHVETLNLSSSQSPDQSVETHTNGNGKPPEANPNPSAPSLEIPNEQFVGALLILHELGEYELVLKLSRPYLSSGNLSSVLNSGNLGDPELIRPDIVLTIALACLELGREQWQQGQYENAATSLETGQKLLLSEGLFPSVRGEIQADLYKLRPYRILELLALADENLAERRQGLRLLQDMLQERGGIDGTGNDQSGLSIDDFLRFIQQLRGYLTSAEQQALFEAEAKRPSAVATYLAVYALMGRGFSQRQPDAIARAKQMLMRLGKRQDVHLEQAVCALLLGQTEEASRALELSQEYEPLAFIREHSQGSPDLLPGLCLYGERWLQTEVFPHFRDLAKQRTSLKDYFADEQVQAYLENMPVEADAGADWAVVETQRVSHSPVAGTPSEQPSPRLSDWRRVSEAGAIAYRNAYGVDEASLPQQVNTGSFPTQSPRDVGQQPAVGDYDQTSEPESVGNTNLRYMTATLTPTVSNSSANGVASVPPAERLVKSPEEIESDSTSLPRESSPSRRRRQPRSREQNPTPIATRLRKTESESETFATDDDTSPRLLPGGVHRTPGKLKRLKAGRLILLAAAGLLGLGILATLVIAGLKKVFHNSPAPALQAEQPLVQLDRPPLPIPPPDTKITAPDGPLTEETAKELIETWLSSKAQALGENHQVEQLEQILAEPALSRWTKRAVAGKNNNSYGQYKHNVEVKSVKTSDNNPDQGSVDAAVSEVAQFYKDGKLNQSASYDDNLVVRYNLVRKDNQWRIQEMKVLK